MTRKPCCYALVDPATGHLRYVGVTKNPLAHRLQDHCNAAAKGSPYPVCRWIRKLAAQGLSPQIVCLEVTDDRLRECVWIAYFKSRGAKLLNCTAGGEGLTDPTAETREKLRLSHLGKKPSAESIEKRRQKMIGFKHAPAFGEAIRQRNLGKTISPEAKEKMRAAKLGGTLSAEHKAKIGAKSKGNTYRLGKVHSAEHKAKVSAALGGKPKSEQAKANMRKPKSEAARANMSAAQKGRKCAPFSAEHRASLSKAGKGRKMPAEAIAKTAAATRKAFAEGRRKKLVCPPERVARGTAQPHAKLNDALVADLRRRYKAGGITSVELARECGVSQGVLYNALTGKTWSHVAEPPYVPQR